MTDICYDLTNQHNSTQPQISTKLLGLLDIHLDQIIQKCELNAPIFNQTNGRVPKAKSTGKSKAKTDEFKDTAIDKRIEVNKKSEHVVKIPTLSNYNDLIHNAYTVDQLKSFAKHYKLKISGTKTELVYRIYYFLYLSNRVITIQKIGRKFLVKKYISLHGPASIKRHLCTNSSDFVTLEPVEEIPFHQFFSYKDNDGFVYGFDLNSLYNMIRTTKSWEVMRNPYNRNEFSIAVVNSMKTIIRLSRILNIKLQLKYENEETVKISDKKAMELRAITLFQHINELGNYSNAEWFLSLNRERLIRFVTYLCDIWKFRAQLSPETKREICPPFGHPFRNICIPYLQDLDEHEDWIAKNSVLEVLEKMVNSGINQGSRALGAYYVLGALTMVSTDASASLPWLFESFGL